MFWRGGMIRNDKPHARERTASRKEPYRNEQKRTTIVNRYIYWNRK